MSYSARGAAHSMPRGLTRIRSATARHGGSRNATGEAAILLTINNQLSTSTFFVAPSTDEVQPIGNVLRKNVGIHHHDEPDDGCKRHGAPEQEAENGAFVAYLIGRGRCNANRLRVNHLAHHAPGAIRGAHQNRAEIELLGGDFLQTSEKRVRRGVAASQRDAQPSDVSAEERKEPARPGECQPQHRVHARVARHVTYAEHASHRDDGESQSHERFAEDAEDPADAEPEKKSSKDCGKETTGARSGQPVEIEAGGF